MPFDNQSHEDDAKFSNKEKFDALMKLADFRVDLRNRRQQIQLRLTIGLWAALAGAIYLRVRPPGSLLLAVLALVVIGHLVAVARAAAAHGRDSQYARYYSREAEWLLSGLPNRGARPPPYEDLSWPSRWMPALSELVWIAAWVGPTLILAVCAYVLTGTVQN